MLMFVVDNCPTMIKFQISDADDATTLDLWRNGNQKKQQTKWSNDWNNFKNNLKSPNKKRPKINDESIEICQLLAIVEK